MDVMDVVALFVCALWGWAMGSGWWVSRQLGRLAKDMTKLEALAVAMATVRPPKHRVYLVSPKGPEGLRRDAMMKVIRELQDADSAQQPFVVPEGVKITRVELANDVFDYRFTDDGRIVLGDTEDKA